MEGCNVAGVSSGLSYCLGELLGRCSGCEVHEFTTELMKVELGVERQQERSDS